MGFSPINNCNYHNLKPAGSSRSFNDGTEELLRNVLGGLNFYDYQSRDVNDNGSNRNSNINQAELLKTVTDSWEQVFADLNLNSADLPLEAKNEPNSVYIQAQPKINQWAAVNGMKPDNGKTVRRVFE
jgi:hypothetical protein